MHKVLPALLLVLLASPARAQPYVARVPAQTTPEFVGWVPDEFIVVFDAGTRGGIVVGQGTYGKPTASVPSIQKLLTDHGAVGIRRQFTASTHSVPDPRYPDLSGYYKVKLRSGASLDAALDAFRNDPHVEHVERIGMHSLSLTPNDPYYQGSPNPNFNFDQWHYWDTHSIHADQAWNITTGDDNVVVGILDSGCRYFHVDLGGSSSQWGPSNPFNGGNIFINSGETPGDGIDNDGNGFIDDTIGWDFVVGAGGGGVTCIDGDCDVADNDPDDYNGHGTHVSGTVGAITNNGTLVSGIAGGFAAGSVASDANGCKILPLRMGYHARVQGQVTGVVRMDWAAEAMDYVAALVDAGVNVAAINCSWSSSNTGGIGAAVDALLARDVMIVHAAGNSNSSVADFLGGKAGVMNVAATDQAGAGASFTNYGSWVDVAAPGVSILSTWREPSDPDPTHQYLAVADGTSMSSPHICGIAALLESCNPALSGPDKFALIVNNTDPYSDVRDLGSGIANVYKALQATTCSSCNVVAAFTAFADSGCVPIQTVFSDQSTGSGISSWSWDFGDGGMASVASPVHEYTVPGIYTVTLVVGTGACNDTLVVPQAVQALGPPVPAFTAAPDSGDAPLSVTFSDASTGSPFVWFWEFGDGGSSNDQNPTHEYTTAGLYNVRLFIANSCGVDSLTQVGLVEVTSTNTAVFSGGSTRGPMSWISPSPFSVSTQILFRVDRSTRVTLVVYDIAGRPVRRLGTATYAPGVHRVPFDAVDDRGTRLAAGVYVYRLVTDGRTESHKFVVAR